MYILFTTNYYQSIKHHYCNHYTVYSTTDALLQQRYSKSYLLLATPREVELLNLAVLVHLQNDPALEDHVRDDVGLQQLSGVEQGAAAIGNDRRGLNNH